MFRYRLLLCVLLLVIFPASALERPEVTFKIFQFPANMIPRIDGNDDDWAMVPDSYAIGMDQLEDTEAPGGHGTDRDPKDLDVKVKVGWVKGLNRVVGACWLGSLVESAAMAAVVLACGAGVLYVAQSGYWAVTADIGGEYVEVVSGIMNMGGQIGGACTATLTPSIAAHFGWEMSFAVAAALAGMGALTWLLIDPRKPINVEP